jgi:hypothetical protein
MAKKKNCPSWNKKFESSVIKPIESLYRLYYPNSNIEIRQKLNAINLNEKENKYK